MANRLFTAFILAVSFFAFTQISQAMTVRVAVMKKVKAVTISSEWPVNVVNGRDGSPVAVAEARTMKVKYTKGGFSVNGKNISSGDLRFSTSGIIKAGGASYHGMIQVVKNHAGGAAVVNHVDMEDYVAGVISREMGPEWPLEALKAQAIASRTYAIMRMDRAADRIYDLDNTVASQVYHGTRGVGSNVKEAVFSTSGMIAMYEGEPAYTFYHSSAGGMTEDLKYVWGRESRPYLTAQTAPYEDASRVNSWRVKLGAKEIQSRLAKAGFRIKQVNDVEVLSYTSSGRVKMVRVTGAKGQKQDITAGNFRCAVGETKVRSTKFTIAAGKKGSFIFEGEGFGHAVGMSQWSARGMAEHGATSSEIIEHFYPGVYLSSLDDGLKFAEARTTTLDIDSAIVEQAQQEEAPANDTTAPVSENSEVK